MIYIVKTCLNGFLLESEDGSASLVYNKAEELCESLLRILRSTTSMESGQYSLSGKPYIISLESLSKGQDDSPSAIIEKMMKDFLSQKNKKDKKSDE